MGQQRRPLHVFALGSYRWQNKGDAALALAMEDVLEASRPDLRLTITSFDPEADQERYGIDAIAMALRPNSLVAKGIHVVGKSPLRRIAPYLTAAHVLLFLGFMKIWTRAWRRWPKAARRALPSRLRRFVDCAQSSDLVVGIPGGYLLAPARSDAAWLYHLANLAVPLALGRRVQLLPCSIGPFVGIHERFARWLFPAMDTIVLREEESRVHVLETGVPPGRIRRAPDMAFALEEGRGWSDNLANVLSRLEGRPKPWIGFSVRHHSFPGHANPAQANRAYLDAIAACVRRVTEGLGGTAIFVPQSLDRYGRDVEVSREVDAAVGEKAVVLSDDLDPYELRRLYAKLDLLVGTRMHANILALSQGTPVVAIAYEHKTLGIMADIGLREWAIPIAEVEGGLLLLLDKAFAQRQELRHGLATKIPELKAQIHSVTASLLPARGAR